VRAFGRASPAPNCRANLSLLPPASADAAYVVFKSEEPLALYVWDGDAAPREAKTAAAARAAELSLTTAEAVSVLRQEQGAEAPAFKALFPAGVEHVGAAAPAKKKKRKNKKGKGGPAAAGGAPAAAGAEDAEDASAAGSASPSEPVSPTAAAEAAPAPAPTPAPAVVVEATSLKSPTPEVAAAAEQATPEAEPAAPISPPAAESPAKEPAATPPKAASPAPAAATPPKAASPAPPPAAAPTPPPAASPPAPPPAAATPPAAKPSPSPAAPARTPPSVARRVSAGLIDPLTRRESASATYLESSAKAWGGAAAPPPLDAAKVAGGRTIPYTELKALRAEAGVEMAAKEAYLSDAEFEKVFGRGRAEWLAQPAWKRTLQKKAVGLF
jgi:hypothetical protein